MQKPWLEHYESHVPEHISYPDTALPEVLQQTTKKYPNQTAILFKGARLTYREFDRAVNQFASALQELGVQPGDRVAIQLPNCPQFPIASYAILRIGGIVVPCNPLYQAHEMVHQLNDSGAEIIITLSSIYPLIHSIRAQTRLRHVLVAKIKSYFPPHLRMLFTLLLEKKKGHQVDISGDENTQWFEHTLQRTHGTPRPVQVRPGDTAVLMYTGGTTGLSKGAELTHRNIFVNAYQCKIWLDAREGLEIGVGQLPLFHSFAMTTCMNLAVLIGGTMLLIPDPRDLHDVVNTLAKYRPTLYPGTPAVYTSINNYPHIEKYDLKSIRVCVSGASGLPVEVQKRFEQVTGARLVEGYGLSEASPVTHANPLSGENRIGTIGLPWPDTEVKIVDSETGLHRLGVGEDGELCIRGPQVMKGYWRNPAETANVLRYDPSDPHGGPWLYTGDIGTMDADGYFRIVDRKKDIIITSGGYKIFPREIEEVLYTHPKVLEAVATGVPYESKGDRVKAFVVLRPGVQATPDELVEFCRSNLAPYKVPKSIEFRDSVPKTLVGKPLRRQLRAEELEKLKVKVQESEHVLV